MADTSNARSESVLQGHTPGPWLAEQYGGTREDSWFVYSPLGRICGGANKVSGPDARLIAAAPELLEAGIEAEWFLAHYADYIATVPVDEIERHPYLPDLQEKLERLRTAIAKATSPTNRK